MRRADAGIPASAEMCNAEHPEEPSKRLSFPEIRESPSRLPPPCVSTSPDRRTLSTPALHGPVRLRRSQTQLSSPIPAGSSPVTARLYKAAGTHFSGSSSKPLCRVRPFPGIAAIRFAATPDIPQVLCPRRLTPAPTHSRKRLSQGPAKLLIPPVFPLFLRENRSLLVQMALEDFLDSLGPAAEFPVCHRFARAAPLFALRLAAQ